jgi:hypothetical protein
MFTFKKLVVMIVLSFVGLAAAQNAVCMINNGRQVDEVHTKYWQFALEHSDQAATQEVAGTWYVEQASPDGMMQQQLYVTYEANGLYSYQDQTCSSVSCSQNQGYGRWAATRQADGSIYISINFSDLNNTNACTGLAVVVQGNQLLTPGSNAVAGTRVQ